METTKEFLADKVYLPGYMLIDKEDYDKRGATFSFNVKEPPVARGDLVHYFTPRGLHICISQAGYALVEQMAREDRAGDLSVEDIRRTLLGGRVKIIEIYERFRKEVGLREPIQGRFDLNRYRLGKLPIIKLDFDFANGAVNGNFTSVIAPSPQRQLNADIVRI